MAHKSLHILVGLDLSKMDPYLIDYMKTLNQIFNIDKVTFLHNIKIGELPKDLLSDEQLKIIQKRIKKRVDDLVEKADLSFSCETKVTMENLSEVAFHQLGKQQHFDLLVLGNKQELEGNGALSYKLLRLFPSPVLVVPENFKTPIKTIVNAITFSRYTKNVLRWAERFTSSEKDNSIEALSVNISKIFYYPLMSDKEAKKAAQEDIKQKKKKWKKNFQDFGEINIVKAEEKSVPNALLSFAKNNQADIVVLGVKSNSIIRNLMVGSVANDLFTRASNIALLFVKSSS